MTEDPMTNEQLRVKLKEVNDGFKNLDLLVRGTDPELNPGIVGVLTATAKTTQENALQLSRMKWVMLGATVGGSLAGGGLVAALLRVWENTP